jgi:cysteine desulfuration protein SufE
VRYLAAVSDVTLADLYETFEALDDWMDRYAYLNELGQELEPLTDDERSEANLVQGCLSRVWLVADPITPDGLLHYRADSEAHIVKGLIAVALVLFNDKTPQAVATTNPGDVYERLGLDQHLSMNRRNGFVSMMGRIKTLAVNQA